jgi:hypothetical protein
MNQHLQVGMGAASNGVALSRLLKPERLGLRRCAPPEP